MRSSGALRFAIIGAAVAALAGLALLPLALARGGPAPAWGFTGWAIMTLTGLASDSPIGGGSGHRSPRRGASVVAMAVGALIGAWLVIHRDLGTPLAIAAGVAGVLGVVASGRE